MERMPDKIDSKFRFVLLAAERAEQMMQGASPKLEVRDGKPCRVAISEILTESVEWDYGPAEEPIEELDELEVAAEGEEE